MVDPIASRSFRGCALGNRLKNGGNPYAPSRSCLSPEFETVNTGKYNKSRYILPIMPGAIGVIGVCSGASIWTQRGRCGMTEEQRDLEQMLKGYLFFTNVFP